MRFFLAFGGIALGLGFLSQAFKDADNPNLAFQFFGVVFFSLGMIKLLRKNQPDKDENDKSVDDAD